jgi:hypothetical protein
MPELREHTDLIPERPPETLSRDIRSVRNSTRSNVMKTVSTVLWAGVFAVSAWYLLKGVFMLP